MIMDSWSMWALLILTFILTLISPLTATCCGTIGIAFMCVCLGFAIIADTTAIFNAFICQNVVGIVLSIAYDAIMLLLISAFAVYMLFESMMYDLQDDGTYSIFRRYVSDMSFPRKAVTIIGMLWSYVLRKVTSKFTRSKGRHER